MDSNLYHLSAAQRQERGIVALPGTLGEAIEELADSELMRKALGDHIHERYVEIKREEWDDYRIQLTQWELDRYLACFSTDPSGLDITLPRRRIIVGRAVAQGERRDLN